MKKKEINIEIIKKNADNFFSQFDEQAEKEFINIFEYFIFKYNLKLSSLKDDNEKTVNKIPDFINNPIKVSEFVKYTREELHDR